MLLQIISYFSNSITSKLLTNRNTYGVLVYYYLLTVLTTIKINNRVKMVVILIILFEIR